MLPDREIAEVLGAVGVFSLQPASAAIERINAKDSARMRGWLQFEYRKTRRCNKSPAAAADATSSADAHAGRRLEGADAPTKPQQPAPPRSPVHEFVSRVRSPVTARSRT